MIKELQVQTERTQKERMQASEYFAKVLALETQVASIKVASTLDASSVHASLVNERKELVDRLEQERRAFEAELEGVYQKVHKHKQTERRLQAEVEAALAEREEARLDKAKMDADR